MDLSEISLYLICFSVTCKSTDALEANRYDDKTTCPSLGCLLRPTLVDQRANGLPLLQITHVSQFAKRSSAFPRALSFLTSTSTSNVSFQTGSRLFILVVVRLMRSLSLRTANTFPESCQSLTLLSGGIPRPTKFDKAEAESWFPDWNFTVDNDAGIQHTIDVRP